MKNSCRLAELLDSKRVEVNINALQKLCNDKRDEVG